MASCIGSVGKSMKSVNPKKSASMKSANTKSGKSVSKKPSHSGGGSVVKKPANTKSGKSVSKKPSHSGGGSVVKKHANPRKSVNPKKSASMKSTNTKSGKSVSKKPSHSGGGPVVTKPANPGKSGKLASKKPSAAAYKGQTSRPSLGWHQKGMPSKVQNKLDVKPWLQRAWHQKGKAEAISEADAKAQPWMFEIAQTFKSPDRFIVWLSCATSEQIPDGLMVMKKEGGAEGKLTFLNPVTKWGVAEWPIISERSE